MRIGQVCLPLCTHVFQNHLCFSSSAFLQTSVRCNNPGLQARLTLGFSSDQQFAFYQLQKGIYAPKASHLYILEFYLVFFCLLCIHHPLTTIIFQFYVQYLFANISIEKKSLFFLFINLSYSHFISTASCKLHNKILIYLKFRTSQTQNFGVLLKF